jgi:hypothetical protein
MGAPAKDGRILDRARGTAAFGCMLVGISMVCLGFPVICCTLGIAAGVASVAANTGFKYSSYITHRTPEAILRQLVYTVSLNVTAKQFITLNNQYSNCQVSGFSN